MDREQAEKLKVKKDMTTWLTWLREEAPFKENLAYWHTIPERQAQYVSFPEGLDQRIQQALQSRGVNQLYSHQARAFQLTREGKHIVAVTPTASGKTMCYNLPVLQGMIDEPEARALYLFPTKALAQDQNAEMNELIDELGLSIKGFTYDGDTPSSIRQKVRQAGNIVITNPDMLHSAILPHHTKWVAFFEKLKYVVIDELHTYRGVFGSHVANVIRRLKRICQFYGSHPLFICTSATIANPQELGEMLIEEPMQLVDNNGAPSGKKHFIFYNPPVVNKTFNIRQSATFATRDVAFSLLKENIQTIVFTKSRVRVELLLSYLQAVTFGKFGQKGIRGYRGGYLPKERREIERGLRNGEIMGVVSTNALELGVDIGQLQACVINGYPGTVASTWQQAGRAGRRQNEAVIIFVASSTPMDQYIVQHPEYFFDRSPERAKIDPNNLIILIDHIKCAAFELPFKDGEVFGTAEVRELLDFLTEEKVLHYRQGRWYWMNDSFPAHNISLRSASQENIIIIDQSVVGQTKVIGEMDRFSALTLLHDEAIYFHQGVQYQVEKLDYEEKKAFVREVDVEYFTDANLAVQLKVLEIDRVEENHEVSFAYGEVMVNAMATIFKKIKLETHENIGSGPIHLPEEELHTNATWLSLPEAWVTEMGRNELEQGLIGLAQMLRTLAAFRVMCDTQDIFAAPQVKAVHSEQPTIFLYDRYPGGIGLAEQVFKEWPELLREVEQAITHCACQGGCPSCVGTHDQAGQGTRSGQEQASQKSFVLKLIRRILKKDELHVH